MARPIRVEYAGAVYHVMAQGNQGQKIYADSGDRKVWLATVSEACRRTGWRIHASSPGAPEAEASLEYSD